ncbi:MBL fold metallo-hydrolase [Saccharicrinis sp. FJH62]|uniref:MBL fold metallo-hydrolase n=1 Tax=Saccharicrinis sp. FJH62 TaxID=3344657 RepID=UPI0035D471B1
MLTIKTFIFNPFQENTYVVSDESGACVIIDPGCSSDRENSDISAYIEENKLKPEKVWCTHLHVDHVLGNAFFYEKYGLKPEAHFNEQDLYNMVQGQAQMFGLVMNAEPPSIGNYLNEGDLIRFGNTTFKVLLVPGHSPGGLCFYSENDKVVFAGDCLFSGSIGRTDLWGGDHDQLISRIKSELLTLPDETVVYSGHGPKTTIGEEEQDNPFIN